MVAALGDCALGCNLLGHSQELTGPLESILPVHIRIGGCPPTPASIATAPTTAPREQPLGERPMATNSPRARS
ncbi:MAG: hypothetical protein ACLPY3_06230 [Solirubrobacteraceae bacterium]